MPAPRARAASGRAGTAARRRPAVDRRRTAGGPARGRTAATSAMRLQPRPAPIRLMSTAMTHHAEGYEQQHDQRRLRAQGEGRQGLQRAQQDGEPQQRMRAGDRARSQLRQRRQMAQDACPTRSEPVAAGGVRAGRARKLRCRAAPADHESSARCRSSARTQEEAAHAEDEQHQQDDACPMAAFAIWRSGCGDREA